MRTKNILLLGIMSLIVIGIVIGTSNKGLLDMLPSIADKVEISDKGNIEFNTNDFPQTIDSLSEMTSDGEKTIDSNIASDDHNNNVKFWVDENGTKTYVINAIDSPVLEP